MTEAIIFDVDGTLIDTVDLHAASWQETFQHFGLDPSYQEVRSQIGKGGDQLMPVFVPPELLDARREEIEAYRSRLFKHRYLPRARGFPKVRELFEQIRAQGRRIAVGSSCKADELPRYTDLAQVTDLIDVAATSDDAEHSKPSPEIFQAAAAKLAPVPREQMVVVGDSPFDAIAARRAGLHAVGLLCGGFPAIELRRAGFLELYRDPADLLDRYDRSLLSR